MKTAVVALVFLFFNASLFSKEPGRTSFELQLDPYYTAFGIYNCLTAKEMEHLTGKTEMQIYRYLLKKFYVPRILVLEASVNPMPYLGTVIRRSYPSFYDGVRINDNFNIVHAVTAGFEEPWAFSVFFGNVVSFDSIKKSYEGKRKGYAGFLVDMGDYHIKDNILYYDKWIQTEIKLKGEQILREETLTWSFRVGAKFHERKWIRDSLFIGLRRSRTDFGVSGKHWYNNSGFEYVSSFSMESFEPIRHYFLLEKKFPARGRRMALSLGAGFVWNSDKKYSKTVGEGTGRFQFIIRPNLEF